MRHSGGYTQFRSLSMAGSSTPWGDAGAWQPANRAEASQPGQCIARAALPVGFRVIPGSCVQDFSGLRHAICSRTG